MVLAMVLSAQAQFQLAGRVLPTAPTTSSGGAFSLSGRPPWSNPPLLAGGAFGLTGSLGPSGVSSGEFDPQPDPPKPQYWWSGEGDALDQVSKAQARIVGGLTFTDGLVGKAFRFNGKDTALNFGPVIGNFETNDFTVEFFVQAAGTGRAALLSKRPRCDYDNLWEIRDGVAGMSENVAARNAIDIRFDERLADGDWHHLAFVRSGTTVSLYRDGVSLFRQSFAFVTRLSNSVDLVAGDHVCIRSVDGTTRLNGLLDEIKIYGQALTADQVSRNAQLVRTLTIERQPMSVGYPSVAPSHTLSVVAFSSATTALRYQWYFEDVAIPGATERSYTIAPVDAHAMGRYHVKVKDGITTVRSDDAMVEVQSFALPKPAHWWPLDGDVTDVITGETGVASNGVFFVSGRVGQACDFRGTNYLNLGARAGSLGTSDFTVTLWMFARSNVVSPTLLDWKPKCGASTSWQAGLGAPGGSLSQPRLNFIGGNFTQIDASPAGRFPTNNVKDGRWHHLAFVRRGTNAFVYRDGTLLGSDTALAVADLSGEASLIAGIDRCNIGVPWPFNPALNNNPFLGQLDEIKIYRTALVGPEIAAESRQAPVLVTPTAPRVGVSGATTPTVFKWQIDPTAGQTYSEADIAGVDLETSSDLRMWTMIPGAVRVVNGRVEIVDLEAFAKRESYYRIVYRDPVANSAIGGDIALSSIPASLVTEAQRHIAAFIGDSSPSDPDNASWSDVTFASTARQLFDPAHKGGAEAAFVELKVVNRINQQPRGFVLVSLTDGHPTIVEFSTEGLTKTERALEENPGLKPRKFMRYGAGFLALEDASGALLGTLGTWPVLPNGPAPTEAVNYEGAFDSETGLLMKVNQRMHKPFLPVESYGQLRSSFAANPTRLALRQLRTAAVASRAKIFIGLRNSITLGVGASQDVSTDQGFASVVVDVDDEEPSVRVGKLARGFRLIGVKPGTDLVRARTVTGLVLTYTVVVPSRLGLAGIELQSGCDDIEVSYWGAGTGWNGDQRKYRQLHSPDWCPVVGCGPTALMMLFGWWDVNGVPSAFYQVRSGIGDPDDFRFDLTSLRTSDAPQIIYRGETAFVNGLPTYVPSPEEVITRPVARDLFELCSTFCVSGQGATAPGDLFDGATDYIDRAVKNLSSPQNEYGEQLMGAQLRVKYTDGYWLGMTDWEGGGLMVANDIKEGRPGIVGLGDTVFDLHYALAYAYKRVDYYEGCGANRERVDRRRWFKCNMGWGSKHNPEWHDAESVWLGMTAKLWQKKLPQ